MANPNNDWAQNAAPLLLDRVNALAGSPVAYRQYFVLDLPATCGPNEPIQGYCIRHRLRFETTWRYLLLKTPQQEARTCPCCDYEHGMRKRQPWTVHRVQDLLESIGSPWRVQEFDPDLDRLINYQERVALVCTVRDPVTGEPCIGRHGKPPQHTMNNIQTLQKNPLHIVCQGRLCFERRRGQRRR